VCLLLPLSLHLPVQCRQGVIEGRLGGSQIALGVILGWKEACFMAF
jgi:hypothetical protein